MTLDWSEELSAQLTWHWDNALRPRLDGLSDAEYLWEAVEGAWNLRPRGQARTSIAAGSGDAVMEFESGEPTPAPVTTIAWRLGHLLVGVFEARNASHFGGQPVDYRSYDYPTTAADALARLDDAEARWVAGVRSLTPADLEKPCGEDGFETSPMAGLVLHIHREVIHHGAEIALLRDLYAWR